MNKTEFQEKFRKDLRGKKNKWLFLQYNVNDKDIRLKIWNNWSQIFTINGRTVGMPMEITQKELIQRVSDKIYD